MTKTIRLLTILLGVQVLFALGFAMTRPGLAADAGDDPLLALDGEVDHLTIEGPDTTRVVLTKADGAWQLPSAGGFPADSGKVRRLLDRLESLKQGRPMAATGGAHTRFKVEDDAFERRITLAGGGDTLAVLYLGTSPNTRQVHARIADDNAVYAVNFATYEAPSGLDDWQDNAVLELPKADIAAIDVAGLHLRQVADPVAPATDPVAADSAAPAAPNAEQAPTTWQATGLSGGETLDPEAADKLAGLLADLQIGTVLGREERPDFALDRPVLSVSLTRKGGTTIEYRLGKNDADEYTLKVSSRPEYFRLPFYTADPLIEAAARGALIGGR